MTEELEQLLRDTATECKKAIAYIDQRSEILKDILFRIEFELEKVEDDNEIG